ncbi:MAG: molybdopterin-dependent oxidoreductase [Pirellulales bacterium]
MNEPTHADRSSSALAQLPPGQQLVARDKWPVIGERSPLQSDRPWTLTVQGLVSQPTTWSCDELLRRPRVDRVIDIHCVTRWSRLQVPMSGVPLALLLAEAQPLPEARFVRFVARSERAHDSSLSLAVVRETDPLIAITADGAPLSQEHGGPFRLAVPGRYFYKSVKWLEEIELLAEDRLGYWESEAGYHNQADPWLEQRYATRLLPGAEVAERLIAGQFDDTHLLGLQAAGGQWLRFSARRAVLRNAKFDGCRLMEADFTGANLSNGSFVGADLRGANFAAADVEGADFSGADLRGADLASASVFGVTLGGPGQAAVIDATTRWPADVLEQLTPDQIAYLQGHDR